MLTLSPNLSPVGLAHAGIRSALCCDEYSPCDTCALWHQWIFQRNVDMWRASIRRLIAIESATHSQPLPQHMFALVN